MKNNYFKSVLLFCLIFIGQITYSQNKLLDSKHESIIENYINKQKNKHKLSSSDIENVYLKNEVFSKSSASTQSYLNQTYKGIKVHNAISTIAIKDNEVYYFSNKFKSNIAEKINTTTPRLNMEEAIQKVASHFNLGAINALESIGTKNDKNIFSKGNISREDIPIELVYFELPNGSLKLCWDLSIYTMDGKHWWSVRVDAVSGKILDFSDWVINCSFGGNHTAHGSTKSKNSKNATFNLFKANNTSEVFADGSQYFVLPLPIETPDDGNFQLTSEPASTLASEFGWHDDDGVAGAEYTTTRGNNVTAQIDDDDNNDDTGFAPDGGAALNFNFPLDLNTETPADYQDTAVTQLFYMNNMMHDIWYHYGFDIESGNFQQKHYIRVNALGAGDPVQADAQDGALLNDDDHINNANFATPPDGNPPRMQMYLWNTFSSPPITINNGPLLGDYEGPISGFGGAYPDETPITADVVLVVDDNSGGTSTDPNDACDVITNAAAIAGKVAILRRGDCEFGVKLLAAENAGAIAAIVVTDDREVTIMGAGDVGDSVTIPGVMINKADGDAIIAELNNGNTVNVSLSSTVILRDGDFSNLVIAHEYGHGISTRLTGGATTSNCLNNLEQMGEGWSDWFALMVTMKPGDLSEAPRTIFNYIEPSGTSFSRRAPYSNDFAVNNFTYGATNDNTSVGTDAMGNPVLLNEIVHVIGFYWASTLWDLTWAYVDKYGFDPDLYNGSGGNNKVMQIVIDGLKLQPCSPGMVDARDAILAADVALTGGEDQCLIWEVFAKRGLGVNASQGTTESINDQVEDFTELESSNPSLANCTTLSADYFVSKDYKVYPNPTSDKLIIKTDKNLGDATLSLIDINGRLVLSKKATLLGEVELSTNKLQSGLYILSIKGKHINTNEKIIIK